MVALPGVLQFGLSFVEFVLSVWAVAALYRYVPNTTVRWSHAVAGGLLVGVGLELAKKALAWYLGAMPGMSTIYGAFAAVPILMLWIYMLWAVVLLGAVVAAYLPSLLSGVRRRGGTPGWRFQLAVEAIAALEFTAGGFFTAEDLDRRERVVVLGPTAAEELFGDDDPIGQTVRVSGRSLEVVG